MVKIKKIYKYPIFTLIFIIFLANPKVFAIKNTNTIYFLGDSRFVGMQKYCDIKNCEYYAEIGKGLTYLKSYMDDIKDSLNEDDLIIINFGVNDLGNKEEYVEFLNEIEKEIPARIIYMTINPVEENKGKYEITNEEINEFNKYLVDNTSDNIYIMDTNKYLKENGFITTDGLHYTKETYKDILEYINLYLEYFNEK